MLAVSNYSEMKRRIFWSTFVCAIGCLYLVSKASQHFHDFLWNGTATLKIWELSLPIPYVVFAFAIAGIFRMVLLHDKVSDLLGIRQHFDLKYIIVPLAMGVGIDVKPEFREKLAAKRKEVMKRAFYKYAGSKTPQIDPHLITEALDQWSWFWMFVEAIVLGIMTLIALLALRNFKLACWLMVGIVALLIVESLLWRLYPGLARDQVDAIVQDSARGSEVRNFLDAL